LQPGDVFFVDEIHRLRGDIAELLYPAMEDYKLSVQRDDMPPVTIRLERFTLVAATTNYGQLPGPLRDRFGHSFSLDLYTVDELQQMVVQAADKYELLVDRQAAALLAERGRGTPRVALRLLRRSRDTSTSSVQAWPTCARTM